MSQASRFPKPDRSLLVDGQGKNLTIALFKETNDGRSSIEPRFSLNSWKAIYMELADPTEYKAAMALTGDWLHWEQICRSWVIKPIIEQWRDELAVKLRSEAIEALKLQAMSDKGTAAAKWLAEKGFIEDKKKRKNDHPEDITEREIMENAKRLKVVSKWQVLPIIKETIIMNTRLSRHNGGIRECFVMPPDVSSLMRVLFIRGTERTLTTNTHYQRVEVTPDAISE